MAGTKPTRRVQAPRQRTGRSPRKQNQGGAHTRFQWSTRRIYVAALAGAGLLATALIVASVLSGGGGGGNAGTKTSATVVGGAATKQLLAGVPQHGTTLGSPTSPFKLVEYADLQCPYCGIWARDVLPAVVRAYVRPGNVRIQFRGMTFVGADSKVALETALGAASQNRFWNVADLLYRNQGTENTGWLTDPLVRGILRAVPGLTSSRVLAERGGAAVAAQVTASARLAALAGVNSTPTFEFGPSGGPLQRLQISVLDVSAFTAALDAAMNG